MPEQKPFSRLPTNVVPVNYNVELRPDLQKFTFEGVLQIRVQITEPTDTITMNSEDIEIHEASYEGTATSGITYDVPAQTVMFSFPQQLPAGEGVISMTYTGTLNDQMKGFYRTKASDGKYFAVSQFEPTDARLCLPCWDEPAVKSTFDVTLVVEKHLVALSNMSVTSESEYAADPNKKVLKYATTPVMSTYLLAFVVGEYDHVEGVSNHGVKIRVYTPTGKANQGEFALDCAIKCLDYFTDYFKIPYPLDKLDLIAIADFSAGAMENWGLVTYRETCVLYDPATSSKANAQRVCEVVCHELAHQWFGNLVTMEWWTHLWLNEGFASFMQYTGSEHVHPEYGIWTQTLNMATIASMNLDSLDNSHPIEVPVGHPTEVEEIFDFISYKKGHSVIRMVENWVGTKNFKQALHNYLIKHSYQNTFTEDLWAALEKESGLPVNQVMSTWTKQMGYPVINVNVQSQTDTTYNLSVTQNKYATLISPKPETEPMWHIPAAWTTSSAQGQVTPFLMQGQSAIIEGVPKDNWFKMNPGFYGFYRVNYCPELRAKLIQAIRDQQLGTDDKLNFISDLFAMALVGEVPMVEYMDCLSLFENDLSQSVWSEISAHFSDLKKIMSTDAETEKMFKTFTTGVMTKIFEKVGWEASPDEHHTTAALRTTVFNYCKSDAINQRCTEMFLDHFNGTKALPVDLEAPVFVKYLATGGQQAFDNLVELYRRADSQQQERRILFGFSGISEPSVWASAMEWSMNEDNVRNNTLPFALQALSDAGLYGREQTWKYFKANYSTFIKKLGGSFLLSRCIQYITENFVGEEKRQDIMNFFATHEAPASERAIKQSIEKTNLRTAINKKQSDSFKQWLLNLNN